LPEDFSESANLKQFGGDKEHPNYYLCTLILKTLYRAAEMIKKGKEVSYGADIRHIQLWVNSPRVLQLKVSQLRAVLAPLQRMKKRKGPKNLSSRAIVLGQLLVHYGVSKASLMGIFL
jgi:hypothetical protein